MSSCRAITHQVDVKNGVRIMMPLRTNQHCNRQECDGKVVSLKDCVRVLKLDGRSCRSKMYNRMITAWEHDLRICSPRETLLCTSLVVVGGAYCRQYQRVLPQCVHHISSQSTVYGTARLHACSMHFSPPVKSQHGHTCVDVLCNCVSIASSETQLQK